ncbi:hypothetical protein JMJ77_0000165, partial [Colletotrichum scovillei]
MLSSLSIKSKYKVHASEETFAQKCLQLQQLPCANNGTAAWCTRFTLHRVV